MGEIKLFNISDSNASELVGSSSRLERPLQRLIEKHLQTLLRIRFLASEYNTGKTHGGRIDTLGLDENNCPVIIEYKRSSNENVINQGLYYLDWLLDHKAEFKLLVLDTFGKEYSDEIDWSPRLLCIATDFTKFDSFAVQQISKNIELIKYRHYENGIFMLEQVNSFALPSSGASKVVFETIDPAVEEPRVLSEDNCTTPPRPNSAVRTFAEQWAVAPLPLRERFDTLRMYALSLGDVVEKPLKFLVAFRLLRNFASIWLIAKAEEIVVNLNLDPSDISPEDQDFCRDVGNVGHWGSGQIEMRVKGDEDLVRALRLISLSFEKS